jgi:hypothetical protein
MYDLFDQSDWGWWEGGTATFPFDIADDHPNDDFTALVHPSHTSQLALSLVESPERASALRSAVPIDSTMASREFAQGHAAADFEALNNFPIGK